ncbi:hypothetical protein, partial [Bradyrhizobium lablabi]|uniref:hypothetical protein n=1 Tax=Bradyrhizobium lablabi TaxID=722472 RepID=UPI001BAD7159
MSDDLNLKERPSAGAKNGTEVFSPQNDLRPTNEFLTEVSGDAADYCVMRCTLPAAGLSHMSEDSMRRLRCGHPSRRPPLA